MRSGDSKGCPEVLCPAWALDHFDLEKPADLSKATQQANDGEDPRFLTPHAWGLSLLQTSQEAEADLDEPSSCPL